MSYLEKNTLQEKTKKINIPEFLDGGSYKKIALPSFLVQGVAKKNTGTGSMRVLAYDDNSHQEIDPHACWETCEVTAQQCKECTTCQGCEDNCQHGVCESSCMSYCETNGESSQCGVCQSYQCGDCESLQCGYCQVYAECGTCEIYQCGHCQVNAEGDSCMMTEDCNHPNAKWTDWYTDDPPVYCKSDLVCKTCKKIIKTKREDHVFKGIGVYRYYDKDYHQEIGSCYRCGASIGYLQRHNFVGGVCSKCGVLEGDAGGGGGGGGGAPQITLLEINPSNDGMRIECNVVAANAQQYIFTLYDDSPNKIEISSSEMITDTHWTFYTIPDTYYTVLVRALNRYGGGDSKQKTIRTPNGMPPEFRWSIAPQSNKVFSECITSSDWNRLQQTINAWRSYYGIDIYKFVKIPLDDNSFTVAMKGHEFTYIYYNQIINSIKTIPVFNGTLPNKLTSNPGRWLAEDFIAFQNAANYFLTI